MDSITSNVYMVEQVRVTIKVTEQTREWLAYHKTNSRSQVGLFSEACTLYLKLYMYLQNNPTWALSDQVRTKCVTPIISEAVYTSLSELPAFQLSKQDHERVGQHLRWALQTYQKLFHHLRSYNLLDINQCYPEMGIMGMLEDLEIFNPNTGYLKYE